MCLGIPGKVIEIYQTNGLRMGRVDLGGVVKEVCLEYVPELGLGDYTIIHVGFAISQIDEDEARSTLEMLTAMDALGQELPDLKITGSAA